jgi:predicted Ser/Thr protein kinase
MLIKIKDIELENNIFHVIQEDKKTYMIDFDGILIKIDKKRCIVLLRLT